MLTNGDGGGMIARLSRKTAPAESEIAHRKYARFRDSEMTVV